MKYWILLSVVAVAICAPLGEQEQTVEQVAGEDMKVKRAKEFMMFASNENNKPKEKRSDPSLLDSGSRVETEGPVDLVSAVHEEAEQEAEPPVTDDAQEEKASKLVVVEDPAVEEEMLAEVEDELKSAEENEEAPAELDSDDVIGSEEVPDEEKTAVAVADEKENSDNGDSFDLNDEKNYMQNYLSLYGQLGNRNKGNNIPYWSPMSPLAKLGFRYRRNSVNNKGNRRIKRDLWDDLASQYQPYEKEDNSLNSFSPEEVQALLDILDNARAIEEEEEEREMEKEEEDQQPWGLAKDNAMDPYLLDGEPGYFVPAKRQAGLNFVPGMKRNNYFYPISREPATHFGAFVPEKRGLGMSDYDSEYERLMQLAAALREQEEYNTDEAGPYDIQDDWQYVYRRK